MSTPNKKAQKHGDTKAKSHTESTSTPSKGADLRAKLEAALAVPMSKTLTHYNQDELMGLLEKVKDAYDLVHTRTLLLPREMRMTEEQKSMIASALKELQETEGGVVDGEEEEEDEDAADQLEDMSDESADEEDGKLGEIMALIKQRLVLNDLVERHNTNDDFAEDDFDFEEGSEEEDSEEDDDEEEEVPAPTKKQAKKATVKVQVDSDEEDEEDEEDGEEFDEEDDGLAQARQFLASFSLLDANGKVVARNIELECNDIYEANGFEGEHSLAWDEDTILSLTTQDGDIIEPEGPSYEELQDALNSEEDFDEEILGSGMPNTWDEDVADALKTKAGFPEDLTPLQFIVVLLRVMSRIVKNAARSPGPAPADGLLPVLALELSEFIKQEEDVEGMDVDEGAGEEDEEESSEEEAPAPPAKHHKKAAPQDNGKKPQQKDAKPAHHDNGKKPQHDAKKHQDGAKKPQQHQDVKKQQHHHDAGKKQHHDAGKKQHQQHHDAGKKQHHDAGKQQHHNKEQQNNKKRPHADAGNRPDHSKKPKHK